MQSPTFSVIIPLEDHRGLAGPNIRSWGDEQTHNRQDIEVVLVADHKEAANDNALKALLQPHDLFVYSKPGHLFELYDVGAREAQGTILLFTEHHVLADPGCIAALADFFAVQPYDAAACRSVGIAENFIAKMQERMFWEIFDGPWKEDRWKALEVRGVAIKKPLYLAVGGFKYKYEFFAEFAMAIDLHKNQYPLGFPQDAIIRHYNTHRLLELHAPQVGFARGELQYRADRTVEETVPYLGYIPEWSERASYRVENARILASAIVRSLLNNGQRLRKLTLLAQGQVLLHNSWYAIWGARWPQFRWKVTLPLAYLKVRLLRYDDEKCYRAYSTYWRHTVYCAYFDFIAGYLPHHAPQWQAATRYELYDVDDEQLVGFNLPECWENHKFRWSGAASMFGVVNSPADYDVVVQLLPFERSLDSDVCLYFNNHQISNFAFDSETNTISFRISAVMFSPRSTRQFLIFTNDTRQTLPPERRLLGLPIQAIEFRHIQ